MTVNEDDIKAFEGEGEIAPSPLNAFVVDVEGFEGPIDVLLNLARDQKVDLVHISIVELADQYLEFVARARRSNLELAADYLVMAAWLAYLKSRLLLPDMADEEEPSGEEMAAALQFQLQRLEAMKNAGQALMERNHLGKDFFARGAPEGFSRQVKTIFEATLYDLLKAYGDQKARATKGNPLHIKASFELYSVEDALQRLRRLVGATPNWESLQSFLPQDIQDPLTRRSALAATFTATLEMAKQGKVKIRQDKTFDNIYLKAAKEEDQS